MIRKLLIVFASGTLIALAAFSAAWVLGGETYRNAWRSGDGFSWTFDDEADAGPRKSRAFSFDSAKALTVAIPAEMHFTRGDSVRMTVEGPADQIDRLQWVDGRLSLPGTVFARHGFTVTIVAPALPALNVESAADIELAGLDQDELRLTTSGAANLDGSGTVRRLFIDARGASNIDLAALRAGDATVRVAGVGNVDIDAAGTVDARIDGAGNLTLHRKPATLRSAINGAGAVTNDY